MNNKQAVLVVSFGTSHNETRAKTIEAIEKAIGGAYPDCEVRRAFTSPTIIKKLAKRDGLVIDNVTEALNSLIADGVKKLIVQPTYVITGFEYDNMIEMAKPFESKFDKISYGLPLFGSDKDYEDVVEVLMNETASYANSDTAIVFMGHGSKHNANAAYGRLDKLFKDRGSSNYFIGTVEGIPTVDELLFDVKAVGAKKVMLFPLMVVAGDHAVNDMAGDDEGSWKNIFESNGYETECVLKGLGEYKGIQDIFVSHTGKAEEKL